MIDVGFTKNTVHTRYYIHSTRVLETDVRKLITMATILERQSRTRITVKLLYAYLVHWYVVYKLSTYSMLFTVKYIIVPLNIFDG